MKKLPVARGQLVDDADQVLDLGARLGELDGVLGPEFLQPDDLLAQSDLGVRRQPASSDLRIEVVLEVEVPQPGGVIARSAIARVTALFDAMVSERAEEGAQALAGLRLVVEFLPFTTYITPGPGPAG